MSLSQGLDLLGSLVIVVGAGYIMATTEGTFRSKLSGIVFGMCIVFLLWDLAHILGQN